MQCTRRVGGWPQIAFVSSVDGTAWFLDGVDAALPPMQRGLAVMTGRASGAAAARAAGSDALLASRLAAEATRSGDIGNYERLIVAGTRANLADSPVAAERAFRAALTLQQKALGADNPNTANTLMLLALQLSNQGQFGGAATLFDRAGQLAARASDAVSAARLLHYRGLNELNADHPDRALALLDQAEAKYGALLPRDVLAQRTRVASNAPLSDLMPDPALLVNPQVQSALLGVVEVRRNRAIALKALGRPEQAETALQSADALARSNDLAEPIVTSRLYRTQGMLDEQGGLSRLADSADSFTRALPGSRSFAITGLLRAGKLVAAGRTAAALPVCRESLLLLSELFAGVDGATLMPCLDAFAAEAAKAPDGADALRSEMFLAAQSAQGGVTSQQIAEASARLLEGSRDPKVADAIRRQQDAVQTLADLYRQRAELAAATANQPAQADPVDLPQRIAAAERDQQEAESALQAASPNYGQLVQQAVPAATVLAALQPNEAFASIVLGDTEGWTFLLRGGHVSVSHVEGGLPRMTALVKRLRASIEMPDSGKLPPFDTAASRELYAALMSGLPLAGTTSLVVAPSGPLLSIPFALLLTGPATAASLMQAPWLIRQMAVSHVPAPANFISLRKLAGTSRASSPWFGMGDFQPIPLAAARAVFPGPACLRSAELLAGLPRLPFAGVELESARKLLGGSTADELLGRDYTAGAVMKANLANYRVLHFASHALLPAELRCEDQPAIVTSAASGRTGDAVLLTADRVETLKLDADTVILSACNSGGPSGATGGESLSGLARAFFFAGARSMMVTHWSANDQTSAFLVVDTLRRAAGDSNPDLAEALRQAQLNLLSGSDGLVAHPFYWAAFALVGEGHGGLHGLAPRA